MPQRQANFCRFTKSWSRRIAKSVGSCRSARSWIAGMLAAMTCICPCERLGIAIPCGAEDRLLLSRCAQAGCAAAAKTTRRTSPRREGKLVKLHGNARPVFEFKPTPRRSDFRLFAAKAQNRLQWRDRAGFSPASTSQRCKLSIRAAMSLSIRHLTAGGARMGFGWAGRHANFDCPRRLARLRLGRWFPSGIKRERGAG